jgi:hypothetical protein
MNYRDIETAEQALDNLQEAYKVLAHVHNTSINDAYRATGVALSEVEEWLQVHKRRAYKVEVQAVVNVPVYVWAEDDAKAAELARELVEAKLTVQPLDIDDIDTDVYECFEAEDMEADSCDLRQGDTEDEA